MPRVAMCTSPIRCSAKVRKTSLSSLASSRTSSMFGDSPDQARWLNHVSRRARIVIFDKRGTGLSDRIGQLPNLDQRMDDARAVMDAVGMNRAAIMGVSEGGSLAALFAASHPERCSALILYGAFARFSDWFPTKQ